MDKQKQTLIDAFVRKIIAATKLQILVQMNDVIEEFGIPDFDQTFITDIQNLYTDLGKFIDLNDQKVRDFFFLYFHSKF